MTTRRKFLKTTVASVAASSAPQLLLAKKTPAKHPVIGEGEFKYECHHGWGRLPANHEWGGASHGVAVDAQGLIYITQHGKPGSVFVFEPNGKLVDSFAPEHMLDGRAFGHGIDIRKEGGKEYIYLAPNSPKLRQFAKYTTGGELVWHKEPPVESHKYDDPKARFNPTNTSFTPDGGFHLGDGYGSHYIHRYDKKGNYLTTFGGKGAEAGKFATPHGQWLDDRDGTPKLVVADRANARLQYVTLDGDHLSFLEGFLFPADIDIQGDIMLVPDLHARVTLLDKNNAVITQLGDDPAWREQVLAKGKGIVAMRTTPERWQPGKFVHPHDACFDKDGNIFVVEWVVGGRVTKLRKVS